MTNSKNYQTNSSSLSTWELQGQEIKVKSSARKDVREKENQAVFQALSLAKRYKNKEYNTTVNTIIERSKTNAPAKKEFEAPIFSGRSAFGIVFGSIETNIKNIKAELADKTITKIRAKKLNEQLSIAINKLNTANAINLK